MTPPPCLLILVFSRWAVYYRVLHVRSLLKRPRDERGGSKCGGGDWGLRLAPSHGYGSIFVRKNLELMVAPSAGVFSSSVHACFALRPTSSADPHRAEP